MPVLSKLYQIEWNKLVSAFPAAENWHDKSLIRKIKIWGENIFFITSDHRTFAYGPNENAILGLGHCNPVLEPTEIIQLRNLKVIDIVCSRDAAFAIVFDDNEPKGNNSLWAWGELNSYLVRPTQSAKQLVPCKLNGLENIKQIAVGIDFVLVLQSNGKLRMCGKNHMIDDKGFQLIQFEDLDNPFEQDEIEQIAAGFKHALLLTKNGNLLGLGVNENNVLGDIPFNYPRELVQLQTWTVDSDGEKHLVPVSNVVSIACGAYLSAYLNKDGSLWLVGGRWKTFTMMVDFIDPMSNQLLVVSFEYAANAGVDCLVSVISNQDPLGLCRFFGEKKKLSLEEIVGQEDDFKIKLFCPFHQWAENLLKITEKQAQMIPIMLEVSKEQIDNENPIAQEDQLSPASSSLISMRFLFGEEDQPDSSCHDSESSMSAISPNATIIVRHIPRIRCRGKLSFIL